MPSRKPKQKRPRKPARQKPALHEHVFADIASRLRATDRDFRFVAEAMPHIVWTGRADGTIDYMNSRWFEYTGLTEDETYKETATAVHPDDLARYKRNWREAVRAKKAYEIEYRFRRAADGMYRWHLGRGLPVKDKRGRVLQWFGTCTDIQEQKEAETQVRRLNAELESKVRERTRDLEKETDERLWVEERDRTKLELLRKMLDTMPMAAAATDADFHLLHANDLFCKLFVPDIRSADLVGKHCIRLIRTDKRHFADPDDYEATLRRMLDPRCQAFQKELSIMDGRAFSFDFIPISEQSQRLGHLLLYRDISQEKRTNTAKTEFMSLASHQLRTPLTSVRWSLGRLSRLLESKLDSRDLLLLRQAKDGVSSMAATITTMLSISRIEAGTLSPRKSNISLRGFLRELGEKFTDGVLAKNLRLRIVCDPHVMLVSDENLLREVFENLLSNAVKYTPAGGSISIGVKERKHSIVISVRDTGHGIPEYEQEKLFTKFFRGENILHIDTEGTGLGLYLVSQLMHLLGGEIRFSSKVNKGTTFELSFPI